MKPVMPALRALLERRGVKVMPVRYYAQGQLVGIGFDATNDQGTIVIEPQGGGNCFVKFDANCQSWGERWPLCTHYYHKKDGFQPSITVPHKKLIPDILKFLYVEPDKKPCKYSLWNLIHESCYTVTAYKHIDTNSGKEVDKWQRKGWLHAASFYREESELNAQYLSIFPED